MKIINAIHAQSIGGVDQVFCNYTQILLQQGHDVALLISDNGNDDYSHDQITLFKLKNTSQIGDFLRLFNILMHFKPDIIICHSKRLMKWMNYLRIFKKIKLIQTQSIAVNHGITFQHSLHCDFIININQQICDLVTAQGFDPKKSFILPNVIQVDQPYKAKNIKPIPTIAMYGRLEKRKGFDILIKACGILANKNYDFRLKLGGFESSANYDWHHLKQLAKDHHIYKKCDFVGIVKDKEAFFKDVDMFCVPSREEPFGIVILESFLHSTLVISSNTDGGKLLIKNESDGLLFENESESDLSAQIIKIIDNPSLNSHLTRNAYSKLVKKFSFDILNDNLSHILKVVKKES